MAHAAVPLKVFLGWSALAVLAGAVWGFVRGLQGGDTLVMQVVAPVEGAVIFGVPAMVLGSVLLGLWYGFRRIAQNLTGEGRQR